jgi:hypothetical protein
MTDHTAYPQEWQRLAWAIGAHDQGADEPGNADHDQDEDEDPQAFRAWAERVHGPAARRHIATHDALMTARFGPETSPDPLTPTVQDSAQFAREIQAIIDAHDDDWEIRDDQIVTHATRFAAQFLPGGIRFPAADQLTRCAVALAEPNDTGRHTVHLLDLGQIGSQVMSDDYATFEQARQAADQWNTANGITPQRAAEILAGPKGPLAAGPARIESVS